MGKIGENSQQIQQLKRLTLGPTIGGAGLEELHVQTVDSEQSIGTTRSASRHLGEVSLP